MGLRMVNQQDTKMCDRRAGSAMLEFVLFIAVILIPFFIAMTEVYRLENYARRMVYSAQVESIQQASSRSRRARGRTGYLPSLDVLDVTVEEAVPLSEPVARLFPVWGESWPVLLSRTYFICQGTGRD